MSQLPIKYKDLEQYKGKEMVIMCKTGNRSKRAQQFLKSQGFNQVTNLAGGIFGWSDQVDSSVPKY
jgi:adenylyltransferase/sulfurtransferase